MTKQLLQQTGKQTLEHRGEPRPVPSRCIDEGSSSSRPYLTAVRTSEAKGIELEAEVVRVHGSDWRAKLPQNPTPAEECRAWDEDGLRIHAASERLRLRAIEWHRGELGRLA